MKTNLYISIVLIFVAISFANLSNAVAQGNGNNDDEKITICHYPPGNPENPQTITISKNALDAHLAHGDNIGSCKGIKEERPFEITVSPNPYEEIININCTLVEDATVLVEVYNVQGNKIKTLINERLTKGEFERSFVSENISTEPELLLIRAIAQTETQLVQESIIIVAAE